MRAYVLTYHAKADERVRVELGVRHAAHVVCVGDCLQEDALRASQIVCVSVRKHACGVLCVCVGVGTWHSTYAERLRDLWCGDVAEELHKGLAGGHWLGDVDQHAHLGRADLRRSQ